MGFIKSLILDSDRRLKFICLAVCAYLLALTMFHDVGATTEIIGYEPAISVSVKDGAKEKETYLVKRNTLRSVLADLGISLNADDKTNIALKEVVKENTEIQITRVTYEEERVEATLPYEVEYIESQDRTLFGNRIKVYGQEGTKEVIYKKKFVNGKEVSRKQIGEEIMRMPVNEVVEQGYVSTGVQFTGRLTRYGADCAGCGTRTAAGLYVTTNGVKNEPRATLSYNGGEYYVLAADASIPFGTIIKVSNHQYSLPDPFFGIVLDRGGNINGTNIDVFCGSQGAGLFSGGTSYDVQFEIVSVGSGETGIY